MVFHVSAMLTPFNLSCFFKIVSFLEMPKTPCLIYIPWCSLIHHHAFVLLVFTVLSECAFECFVTIGLSPVECKCCECRSFKFPLLLKSQCQLYSKHSIKSCNMFLNVVLRVKDRPSSENMWISLWSQLDECFLCVQSEAEVSFDNW